MKIPVKRYDLAEIGYEGYWFEAPQAVTEGFLTDLQKIPDDDDRARKSNVKAFEQVTAWNLDDETGAVMPVFGQVKTYEKKVAYIVGLPVNVVLYIVGKCITVGNRVEEKTKDF